MYLYKDQTTEKALFNIVNIAGVLGIAENLTSPSPMWARTLDVCGWYVSAHG